MLDIFGEKGKQLNAFYVIAIVMYFFVQIAEIKQKTDINYKMLTAANPELHSQLVPPPTFWMQKLNYYLLDKWYFMVEVLLTIIVMETWIIWSIEKKIKNF